MPEQKKGEKREKGERGRKVRKPHAVVYTRARTYDIYTYGATLRVSSSLKTDVFDGISPGVNLNGFYYVPMLLALLPFGLVSESFFKRSTFNFLEECLFYFHSMK